MNNKMVILKLTYADNATKYVCQTGHNHATIERKTIIFSFLLAIACLVAETMLKPSIFTTFFVHDFSLFYFLTKLIRFLQIYSSKSFELEQYVNHKVVPHNHAVILRYCTSPCDILCSFHVQSVSQLANQGFWHVASIRYFFQFSNLIR